EASFRAALQPEVYETYEEEDPLDEQVPFLESSFLGLSPTWDTRLKGWFDRLSRGISFLGRGLERLMPRPATGRPFAEQPAAPRRAAPPGAHRAGAPAGAASAARGHSARERVDHDVYEGSAALEVAWLWLKRAALIAGLLAGGILAAATWEPWVPAAARFGRAIVLEIDRRAHQSASSREREGAQPGG